jgi:hypothetical protein
MSWSFKRSCAAFVAAAIVLSAAPGAVAQTPEQKPQDQGQAAKPAAAPPAEAGKDDKKKVDIFAEAARVLGGPPANAECVWFGRRVVGLLWRDDLDTAFRHLGVYDRFGCPANHIQAAFRCVVRQGNIDPKSAESLNARVDACWLNPSIEASTAAAAPATPGTTAQ